jgi:hypothetical protein
MPKSGAGVKHSSGETSRAGEKKNVRAGVPDSKRERRAGKNSGARVKFERRKVWTQSNCSPKFKQGKLWSRRNSSRVRSGLKATVLRNSSGESSGAREIRVEKALDSKQVQRRPKFSLPLESVLRRSLPCSLRIPSA